LCFAVRYREYREARASREGREIRERRRIEAGQKYCPRCQQVLSRDAFGRNRSTFDGLTAYCRSCHNTVTKENLARRDGGSRDYHLRRRYGISAAEVDAMIEAQGGVCAACKTDEPVHVDHDHKTGRVRGILCFLCNQALGNVRDDMRRLQSLIDYLYNGLVDALGLNITEVEHTDVVFEVAFRWPHAA
jgi:hypothetical protein